MIDSTPLRAWPRICGGMAVVVGLRLRTVASRRPRSGQYHPILALPAS